MVAHLNEVCGTAYKPTTDKTRRCIKARAAEGFAEADFFKVIDTKASQWKGTDMERYLRPETLFGTKFEGYLNESPSTDKLDEMLRGLGVV